MVSLEINSSVLSTATYASANAAAKTENKIIKTEDKLILFGAQVQTGTRQNIEGQNALFHFRRLSDELKASLTYEGMPISQLSADEAQELIGPEGYFGIDKTAQRIADFVLEAAGDDVQQLRAGREGILKGFAEAEKAWGGKLPDISYDTLAKSLEAIDEKLGGLGESIVDLTA
ncbi:MAG: hydrogenase-4 component G [Desulfobacter sp.]|nr:MAG: hydrogenase-4 component G [Desulfobacter sp.]